MSAENTTVESAAQTQAEEKGGQKTFTQEDVNRIVQDRLAKDRAKSSEEMSKKEQELAQREFRLNGRQKLLDRGYPESLMDALNCSSEEAFTKALDIIDGLIKSKEASELEKNKARVVFPRVTQNGNSGLSRESSFAEGIRRAMNL